MNIVVLGAGAVGGYFGARLAESGVPVTFLVRKNRAKQLREQGLKVSSVHGDYRIEDPIVCDDVNQITSCDIVLLAIKGYQLKGALPQLGVLAHKGAVVLPILNGIEHIDVLKRSLGDAAVLGGLAVIVSTLDKAGHIVHTSQQHDLVFGPIASTQQDVCDTFLRLSESANMNVKISDHILKELWGKYTFISAFSGVTTASDEPAGMVRTNPELFKLYQDVVSEMMETAKAYDVDLSDVMPGNALKQIERFPEDATSSMHQDFRKGAHLEVDHLLGGALRLSAAKSVNIPHVETLNAIIKPYEYGQKKG